MRRHLPAFLVLAIAVAAPAVYLGWDTAYSQRADLALARAEERALHARAADAISARIRSELDALVRREEARRYFEYSFVHTPPEGPGRIASNTAPALAYQVSELSKDVPGDPLIRGYFQIDATGRIAVPQVLNNPSPGPRQVAHLEGFRSRLRNFSEAHSRLREQTEAQPAPQRREPVRRSTYDANRNAARWTEEIRKANRGDHVAQQAVEGLQLRQQEAEAQVEREPVEVAYYPFQVFTVDTRSPEGDGARREDRHAVVLLRRIQERDRAEPREYFQGFELDLGYLVSSAFPAALAAVAAPNFAARVVARDAPGDRALVRDLGPYLPVFELRAGPASPESVEQRVSDRRRRLQLAYGLLAAIVAAALALFWRLLRGEVELGRRRQDFVSAVTHELKTPLTSIRMYAELLEDDWVNEPETQREYYGIIRGESERLSRLIANVLDFARLERGARPVKREPVDPAAAVRQALRPFVRAVETAGGRLTLDADEEPPATFPLDRDAFTQVVINLVDNAVKYGEPPPRIEVELRVRAEELELAVENRGAEIPPRDRSLIFEEFRRGKGRRTRTAGGVGLGLALVRRFARAHGGRAECVEPLRGGARFRVVFRRAPAPAGDT